MATVPKQRRMREVNYPTTDGKPMGETEIHIDELIDAIQVLKDRFAGEPNVYVNGNMLLFYEEGNPRKHVSPDVLVALNVPKKPKRDYYLVWKEGKGPDFIVEITSKSTQRVDMVKKFAFYRDVLRVSEYFLFDPRAEYLDPPLQGFRLIGGEYVPIEPINGRLPSEVVGLHLGAKDKTFGCTILARAHAFRHGSRHARPPSNVPMRNASVPTRNASVPPPRKPLVSLSPRRTIAYAGRSRPFETLNSDPL